MAKHFKISKRTAKKHHRRVVYRIFATQDLPEHGVKAGDRGGWVEHERNIAGRGWIADEAIASGSAVVCGRARLENRATALDNSIVSGDSVLSGSASACGNAWVGGHSILSEGVHSETHYI